MPETPTIRAEGKTIEHPDGRRDVEIKVKVIDLIWAVQDEPKKREWLKWRFNLTDKQIDDTLADLAKKRELQGG